MKSLQNISYKTLFTILFFSLAGIVFFLRIGKPANKVSAAWWDEMWHYRQAINISSHTSSESDVYIITSVNIGTTIKAQVDDGDFRFISQSGENLDYYIASGVGTTTISFHILIPSFPAGAQSIYAYYGNTSATNGFSVSDFSTQASNYTIGSLSTEETGGGPIAYWKFDEGVGATAYDFAGNNNGVINKATWSNQGKYDKGLNFSPNQENLLLNYKVWKVGQTGTITEFNRNGAANENYRFFDTDPWGRKVAVWEAITDVASDADGGWDGSNFSIDNTKLYRFSVWVRRTVTGNGSFYLGTHGYGSINGIYNRDTGTTTTNPYFWVGTPTQGVWTLVVGHVWPKLSGTGAVHSDSGRYTISGGKIGAISRDFVWMEESTTSNHRSYLYYSTDTNTRQQWIYPRVDIIDGTEPSIQDLLDGYDSYGADVSATIQDAKESFSLWYDKNSTGNWQHIAKSSSDYYVNGKLATPDEYPVYVSGDDIYLGRTTDSDFVTGSIDEVKIYNYARSADQIKQDYNSRGSMSGAGVNLGVRSNTSPTLKSSLIAHWRFDESYGTSLKNSSDIGSSLNAVIGTASTIPTWTNGKFNKALSFGSNSLAQISNYYPPLEYIGSGGITVSAWVKINTSETTNGIIFSKPWNGSGVYNYFLRYNSNRTISLQIGGSGSYTLSTSTTIPPNEWHYVSATINSDQNTNIYIDGKLSANGNNTVTNWTVTDGNVLATIGCIYPYTTSCSAGTSYGFDGLIDEVKIYNRALTAEEIKQDYNAGSAIQFGSTSQSIGGTTTSLDYCIPGDTSYCASPVAEWKMDEGTGTSIVDTSGNNYTSSYIGSPIKTQGKIGQAISFNGSNNGIGLSGPTTYTKETLSAWVFIDPSSPSGDIVGNCHTNSNSYGFTLYLDGNTLRAKAETNAITYFYNNVTYDVSSLKNKWIHLAMSWENLGTGTSGCDATAKLYVNGQMVSVGTTNFSGGSYNCTLPYNYPFSMGGTTQTSLVRPTKVKLDQVRVYNYVRTPAQIAYDYNRGGPVGWWKFDECQGNIAYDWSGVGNTGTIIIGASGSQNTLGTCAIGTSAAWTNGTTGKINSSLNFDGVDDYVNMGNNNIYNLSNGNTFSMWIKGSGRFSEGATLLNRRGQNNPGFYWLMILNNKGFLQFWNGSSTVSLTTTNNLPISQGEWFHYTISISGETVSLYINGEFVESKIASNIDKSSITSNLYVGSYQEWNSNWQFQGQIDDVRIYNYALTTEQIKTVYNDGAVNFR